MLFSRRSLLLVATMLLFSLLAPVAEAKSKRMHGIVHVYKRVEPSTPLAKQKLDDATVADFAGADGILLIMLPADTSSWDWEMFDAAQQRQEELNDGKTEVGLLAVCREKGVEASATEDLNKLLERMPIGLMSDKGWYSLPEVDDEVLVIFINGDQVVAGRGKSVAETAELGKI